MTYYAASQVSNCQVFRYNARTLYNNFRIRKDRGSELRKYAGVVHINWVTTSRVRIERIRIQIAKSVTPLR